MIKALSPQGPSNSWPSQGLRPCEGEGSVNCEDIVFDSIPPQKFVPKIARDPNIFDNQWFIAFATQDKESGISQFQIKETRLPASFLPFGGEWREAQTPYLLQDQQLASYIYVRAIDKSGNKRVAMLSPWQGVFYLNWRVWGIIILLLLFLTILWRAIRKH